MSTSKPAWVSDAWVAVLTVAACIPWLNIPVFWDEAGYYAPFAYEWFLRPALSNGDHLIPYSISHPPFYYILLGALMKAFGPSMEVLRVGAALVSGALLSAIFGLLRAFGLKNLNAYLWTLAFACAPVFLSERVMIHPDLPMTAALLWSALTWVRGQRWFASQLLALAVLCNLTAVLYLPLVFVIYTKYFAKGLAPSSEKLVNGAREHGTVENGTVTKTKEPVFRDFLIFAAPALIAVIIWMIVFVLLPASFKETFVQRPDTLMSELAQLAAASGPLSIFSTAFFALKRLAVRLVLVFLVDGRWLLTLALLASIGLNPLATGVKGRWNASRFKVNRERLLTFLAVSFIFGFYGIYGFSHSRYLLPLIAMLYLVTAKLLNAAKILNWALPLTVTVLGLLHWQGPVVKTWGALEYRSEWQRVAAEQKEMATHIAKVLPAQTILATQSWVHQLLKYPFLGATRWSYQTVSIEELVEKGEALPQGVDALAVLHKIDRDAQSGDSQDLSKRIGPSLLIEGLSPKHLMIQTWKNQEGVTCELTPLSTGSSLELCQLKKSR